MLLGSTGAKAARKILVKLTPGGRRDIDVPLPCPHHIRSINHIDPHRGRDRKPPGSRNLKENNLVAFYVHN